MTHKQTFFLFLILLLITPINNFIAFAIKLQPNSKSCLKEWFPQNESIAVNFDILAPSKNNGFDFEKVPDKSKDYKFVQHAFLNEKKDILGKIDNRKETWTYVTQEDEIITFCANNLSASNIIIEYNITTNIYNNDHSRVADKTHLKLYEQDINDLEKLTREIASDSKIVTTRALDRKIQIDNLGDLVSKLSGLGILFILMIKVCAIVYLRRKLYEKKIL